MGTRSAFFYTIKKTLLGESRDLSIRIYALAQQLKVETKKLVDILKLAGIEGKGSALASLTDEEVEQVKAAFQKTAPKPSKPGASSLETPFQRPGVAAADKKVPILGLARSKKGEKAPGEIEEVPAQVATAVTEVDGLPDSSETVSSETEPSPAEVPASRTEASHTETVQAKKGPQVASVSETGAKIPMLPPPIGKIDLTSISDTRSAGMKKRSPLDAFRKRAEEPASAQSPRPESPSVPLTTGLSEPGHAAAIRREDYRGPMRVISDRIPVLDARRKKSDGDNASTTGGNSATRPAGPSVRLAPVPKSPTAKIARSNEPTPQKPDMKLPPELIRDAAASGSIKPLEEHIRKHDEKQRLKEEERRNREKGKGRTATPAGAGRKRGVLDQPSPQEDLKKKRRGGAAKRNRNEFEEGDMSMIPRQLKRQRHRGRAVSTAAPRKTDIVVQLPCTVKQFAEQTGLSVAVVIKKLMEMGTPLTINSQLDRDSSELLAAEFGLPVTVRDQVTLEDRLVTALFEQEDSPEDLLPRPPVVTVLGHVDHGKTTLLDRILHLNVVSGEKGGITQHIRAYRVNMGGEGGQGDITFVDTPGHEAFTEMRARGANCTDIVVLVVAADDGVMPQTEEAISHAKAAGVPIIVALNKIDIPGVNVDRVIQELAAHELLPSEWGGDTEMVRCSALTGEGVDKLLETIQVVAEVNELKANPNRPAVGMALEAELQPGQGVICKALVQNGTLRTGDVVLCGSAYGRVRVMYDTLDSKKVIQEAAPSTPVSLIGLDVAPSAGSLFCVLDDISDARSIAEKRLAEEHNTELADNQPHVTLETLFQRMSGAQTTQTLNVIIRADVRGSIEAIRKELGKLDHPEVKIKILQATVGGVTEGDVQLADASDAIIVAFNVVPDENARIMAEKKKIQVRRYDIIYNLTDDIKKALEGMLKPLEQVKELGRALVQKVYTISRVGSIAGCRVVGGLVERDCRIRVIRESRIIGDYALDSLKREKDDVKEIRDGYECGMKLKSFNDLKEGDILEAYKIEEVARTF